jgi:Fe-S cluster assembly protein SufD
MSTQNNQSLPFDGILEQGSDLDWMRDLRTAEYARYAAQGMPTVRQETWKYTRLKTLEDTNFRPAGNDDADHAIDALPSIVGDVRLVFVNGNFRADLSIADGLPSGVTLENLRATATRDGDWLERQLAGASEHAMVSLNTAAMQDGYLLHVGKNMAVETPIEIVFVGGVSDEPVAAFMRNVLVLDEGAEARVIVHHCSAGDAPGFTNTVNTVRVGQNAKLVLTTLQEENDVTTSFAATHVHSDRDSSFESMTLSMGGQLSRTEQHVSLAGEGASCRLDGTYLVRGSAHCDHTTLVDHLVPNTTSNEMFKGVLDDEARAVFQGKIIVHPDAQHTDGRMLNKTLLMSDKSEIDSKPELEIYADDVKCAHGATSGQLDETALFYLQSRGIPEAQARNLLVQSFLGEVIERISDEALRDAVTEKVVNWLPGEGPSS